MIDNTEKIILYTSRWCSHSRSVESFLDRNNIDAQVIRIDQDEEEKRRLIELNDGFASVPTLVFPDGSKLTEPSLYEVREKLGMEQPPGLAKRVQSILKRKKE